MAVLFGILELQLVIDYQPPTIDRPITDYRLPITDYRLPITYT
ncbi:MAG: hypothetical protein PHE56_02715 [Bacteroidales bacterium]|nr:hypothetical protein [Bacteroidales bacterium]